jgi:hypothetical protein
MESTMLSLEVRTFRMKRLVVNISTGQTQVSQIFRGKLRAVEEKVQISVQKGHTKERG